MRSESSGAEARNIGVQTLEPIPKERRLWKRFTVNTACVMAVKPARLIKNRTAQVTLGPLKNVGMKGLSFYYVEKKEKIINSIRYISVALPGEGVVVEKLPFRIVDDFYVARMPGEKQSVEKVKTLCVCFKPLLPQQRIQLEQFISEYGDVINFSASNPEKREACRATKSF